MSSCSNIKKKKQQNMTGDRRKEKYLKKREKMSEMLMFILQK